MINSFPYHTFSFHSCFHSHAVHVCFPLCSKDLHVNALVVWEKDGSKNVVSTMDISTTSGSSDIHIGSKVQLSWKRGIWIGEVIDKDDLPAEESLTCSSSAD